MHVHACKAVRYDLFFFHQDLKERVLKGKYRIPFYLSTDCENLIRKFLNINPAKRTTLEVKFLVMYCTSSLKTYYFLQY